MRLKTPLKSAARHFYSKIFQIYMFVTDFQTGSRQTARRCGRSSGCIHLNERPGLGIWTLVSLNTLHVWCLVVVVFQVSGVFEL